MEKNDTYYKSKLDNGSSKEEIIEDVVNSFKYLDQIKLLRLVFNIDIVQAKDILIRHEGRFKNINDYQDFLFKCIEKYEREE